MQDAQFVVRQDGDSGVQLFQPCEQHRVPLSPTTLSFGDAQLERSYSRHFAQMYCRFDTLVNMIIILIPLCVLAKDLTLLHMGHKTSVLGGCATSAPIRLYSAVSVLHVAVQVLVNTRPTKHHFLLVVVVRLLLPLITLAAPLTTLEQYTCSYGVSRLYDNVCVQ